MKTNKFENTIRQKLESISPDFHEDDWTKMQNYMQVHTPPTFWQQYGSWLGYAAAASVTTVMAFLYVNQLSQNNNLVSDVKKLQNQIEVIKTNPALASKSDTIYIVQKEVVTDPLIGQESEIIKQNDKPLSQDFVETSNKAISQKNNIPSLTNPELTKEKNIGGINNPVIAQNIVAAIGSDETDPNSKLVNYKSDKRPVKETSTIPADKNFGENIITAESNSAIPPANINFTKTLDQSFGQLAELQAMQLKSDSRKMNYALANRLSSRQVKKVWLATTSSPAKQITEVKKAEKTNKTENVIPKLNLKVPYRFGAAFQVEGSNQVKTVLGEVLVAKKFSVSAGISWLKIKPMEFFTEKIFRDKNRQDFKRSHPNQVPMAFEILNINVKPTLVQIPLTVAFRNELKNDFSFYVSAGTNVTVKGREAFSFDCKIPTPKPDQQFVKQSFERKMDIPAINSLNFSLGIEKTWHPVVVQAEGYLYSYFKPLSPDSPRTGPGVKIKVLYQIGRKM